MSLDIKAKTLTACTASLGPSPDGNDVLDEGYLLLHNVSADSKLCEKVAGKLTGFGEVLLTAKESHAELGKTIRSRCSLHMKALEDVKESLEEWNVKSVLTELRGFGASLEQIDKHLAIQETAFTKLESYSRCLHSECAKHGRVKTTAGGLYLASGCLALTLSAATFLIRCAVQTGGGCLSPAASVIFKFSPLNTAIAGGIVTFLGMSDARHSQRYSKMMLDFHNFADDVRADIATIRSFRTRVQRLRHAVDDMSLSLHVNTAVNVVEGTTYNLLLEWIPTQETALETLNNIS